MYRSSRSNQVRDTARSPDQGIARARGVDTSARSMPTSSTSVSSSGRWMHRDEAEVLVGSRYVRGAVVQMKLMRRTISFLLNLAYRVVLSLPYRDISSGFRMYRREVLKDVGPPQGKGLDASPELLVKAYCQGVAHLGGADLVRRHPAVDQDPMLRLSAAYAGTIMQSFGLRNSVKAADYDSRAFDSWIPLQRYWQRRRFHDHPRLHGARGWAGARHRLWVQSHRAEPASRHRHGSRPPEAAVAPISRPCPAAGGHEPSAVPDAVRQRGVLRSHRAHPARADPPVRARACPRAGRHTDPGNSITAGNDAARVGVRKGLPRRLRERTHQPLHPRRTRT